MMQPRSSALEQQQNAKMNIRSYGYYAKKMSEFILNILLLIIRSEQNGMRFFPCTFIDKTHTDSCVLSKNRFAYNGASDIFFDGCGGGVVGMINGLIPRNDCIVHNT